MSGERPWLERIRERRDAYRGHIATCSDCVEITEALNMLADAYGMKRTQGLCLTGMQLQTAYLAEPK